MKEIRIYRRAIIARTPNIEHRFFFATQYIIAYAGKAYRNEHDKALYKTPYALLVKTRSKKVIEDIIKNPGSTDADKWLIKTLAEIADNYQF